MNIEIERRTFNMARSNIEQNSKLNNIENCTLNIEQHRTLKNEH